MTRRIQKNVASYSQQTTNIISDLTPSYFRKPTSISYIALVKNNQHQPQHSSHMFFFLHFSLLIERKRDEI